MCILGNVECIRLIMASSYCRQKIVLESFQLLHFHSQQLFLLSFYFVILPCLANIYPVVVHALKLCISKYYHRSLSTLKINNASTRLGT